MADHAARLRAVFRAGFSGQPMPPRPPDPEAAAINREHVAIHRRLAELCHDLAELDEARA